jgi:hypothetical protein
MFDLFIVAAVYKERVSWQIEVYFIEKACFGEHKNIEENCGLSSGKLIGAIISLQW